MFVFGSALCGLMAARLLSTRWQLLLCGFLIWISIPCAAANYLRPLFGPRSIRQARRMDALFNDAAHERNNYLGIIREIGKNTGCESIAIDNNVPNPGGHDWQPMLEYGLLAGILEIRPRAVFSHAGVHNGSARYAHSQELPCAVVCYRCEWDTRKTAEFESIGPAVRFGQMTLFLSTSGSFSAAKSTTRPFPLSPTNGFESSTVAGKTDPSH
jgi:hypothetical protein